MENRNITGLVIIVWKNEDDLFPREQLVVLKLYNKLVYTIFQIKGLNLTSS